MDSPAFVGFSNYIWNTQYNLALAKKIKAKFPECVILFGGHNVPPDNSFLEKYPFIDFLIHAEGEEAFRSLLLELLKDNPDTCLRMPMIGDARSLNLSNTVAIATYEVLRQWGFPELLCSGELTKYQW